MITASARLVTRRYCSPRVGDRNDEIARLVEEGWEVNRVALTVGTTPATVLRVLSDLRAAAGSEHYRVSDKAELAFALALGGKRYEDAEIRYKGPGMDQATRWGFRR